MTAATTRYSDEGPICPYCGMQATADEACYYDMTEFECDDCGERSSVIVDTVTTWQTRPIKGTSHG